MMINKIFYNKSERGNILFLILIAVALFAALSYAVTQSSRSGGNANRERTLLDSAQITQYPTTLQTAALRMIIDGRGVNQIWYTQPGDFLATGADDLNYIYHPDGGGANYQEIPSNLMVAGVPGQWFVNGQINIDNIGTSAADVIAFLPGISEELCVRINQELGAGGTDGDPTPVGSDISTVYTTVLAKDAAGIDDYVTTQAADTTNAATLVTAVSSSPTSPLHADFDGQPFGCFQNNTAGEHVYYHVIIER